MTLVVERETADPYRQEIEKIRLLDPLEVRQKAPIVEKGFLIRNIRKKCGDAGIEITPEAIIKSLYTGLRGTTWEALVAVVGSNKTDLEGVLEASDIQRYKEVVEVVRCQTGTKKESAIHLAFQRFSVALEILNQLPEPILQEDYFAQIVEKGIVAKDELVEANLRLVGSVACHYTGRGLELEDLIQEGSIGLMRAVEKFNYRRGNQLSTVGTSWIRQAITRAISNQKNTIRIPVHVGEIGRKAQKTKEMLIQELGRSLTPEDLESATGIPTPWLKHIEEISKRPVSLDKQMRDDTTFGDLIADGGLFGNNGDSESELYLEAEQDRLKEEIKKMLGGLLTDRERKIVELRFGLQDGRPRTLEEVGREIERTRERARQIEKKALAKLRNDPAFKKFRVFTNGSLPDEF